MSDDEGLSLEFLDELTFYNEHFEYNGIEYRYDDVENLYYKATATRHSINGIPTGTEYETDLRLYITDHGFISVAQPSSFLRGAKQKARAEAVMRAGSIFMNVTFDSRMERYERALAERGFVEWENFQFTKSGDVFKDHELLFNLKEDNIEAIADTFALQVGKKASGFKEKFVKAWRGNQNIDLGWDKDCFFYFVKHYLNLSWRSQPAPTKRLHRREQFDEAVLVLGARLCKADGKVSKVEIATFKTYFGIDEKSHPGSGKIFKEALESTRPISAIAEEIAELFEGKREPLEYIVMGLMQIAASDGAITAPERKLIGEVCRAFAFSAEEVAQLFAFFKHGHPGSGPADASAPRHVVYLQILGLSDGATHIEIKTAYRNLARKHHPDMLHAEGVPIERIKDAEDILKAVNEAYGWLSANYNPEQRASA